MQTLKGRQVANNDRKDWRPKKTERGSETEHSYYQSLQRIAQMTKLPDAQSTSNYKHEMRSHYWAEMRKATNELMRMEQEIEGIISKEQV